jgi:signal transduction histidine kinase
VRLERTVALTLAVPMVAGAVLTVAVYSFIIRSLAIDVQLQRQERQQLAARAITAGLAIQAKRGSHLGLDDLLDSILIAGDFQRLQLLDQHGRLVTEASRIDAPPARESGSRHPIPSGASCFRCHRDTARPLGTLIVEERDSDSMITPAGLNIAHLSLGGAISALLVSGIVLALTWRFVLSPVDRLANAVRRIHGGDHDARCPDLGGDQIGELADSFNGMLDAVAAHQREQARAYEREMARADRFASVGQLAAAIAHEVKNPLHGAAGALEVLAPRITDDHREIIVEVQAQIQRISASLNRLLGYARPPSPDFDIVSAGTVLQRTVTFLEPDARRRGVTLSANINQTEDSKVWGDAEMMQQVFINLVLNAVEAAADGGGRVRVQLAASADEVTVTVADNGTGIDASAIEKVFEPFFTTKQSGTGLGLAISRSLVEQHRGSLTVECGAETAFIVSLPRRTDGAAATKPVQAKDIC